MYKVQEEYFAGHFVGRVVIRQNADNSVTSFLCCVDNTDYQNFKAQILANEAQLEDVDGNVMSPEAAKEYVRSLP